MERKLSSPEPPGKPPRYQFLISKNTFSVLNSAPPMCTQSVVSTKGALGSEGKCQFNMVGFSPLVGG